MGQLISLLRRLLLPQPFNWYGSRCTIDVFLLVCFKRVRELSPPSTLFFPTFHCGTVCMQYMYLRKKLRQVVLRLWGVSWIGTTAVILWDWQKCFELRLIHTWQNCDCQWQNLPTAVDSLAHFQLELKRFVRVRWNLNGTRFLIYTGQNVNGRRRGLIHVAELACVWTDFFLVAYDILSVQWTGFNRGINPLWFAWDPWAVLKGARGGNGPCTPAVATLSALHLTWEKR